MIETEETLTVYAERVDDFNTRRYRVHVSVTIPADSVGEAVGAVVEAVAGLS